ncbi:MAG: hypothetical protein ACREJD_16600 [Phycisphaerales bacterium]
MKAATLRAILLVPAIGVSAHAVQNNIVQVFVSPTSSGGTGPFGQTIQQPGPLDLSGSATGGGNSSGSGTVHVRYGVVTMTGDSHGTLDTVVRGTFADNITIMAPGVPTGTQGTITYSVRVSGNLHATTGASTASWRLSADIGGGFTDLSKTATLYSPSFPNGYVGDAFGTYSVSVAFTFGVAGPLSVALEGDAQTRFSAPDIHGNSDFGSPLKANWAGVDVVKLSGGQPVPNFFIVSDSGTNWRGAIDICAGDLNGDNQVDDADFIFFAAAYNVLDCADPAMPVGCPADLNGDGVVDDADFVLFVTAYDNLICP